MKHIRGRCVDNLRFWPSNQPWSQHEAFDNVAIGGAAIASLWEETEQTYFASLSSLTTRLQDQTLGIRELAGTIGQLWYALNTCYTLNPRHRPEQANKSQLAQVADRQPRILLINIGSNEGLLEEEGDLVQRHVVMHIPGILKRDREGEAMAVHHLGSADGRVVRQERCWERSQGCPCLPDEQPY